MRYSLALLAIVGVVKASPFPQGVTAVISPTASSPPGCSSSYSGTFGIVNVNATAANVKRDPYDFNAYRRTKTYTGAVTEFPDGQPQATPKPNVMTVGAVSMISDGQVQGDMHTQIMMPVSQIGDGQVQGHTAVLMPVTVISDGQPQAPHQPTSTATAVSQISDGQPQGSTATLTATGVSQTSDAQPQAPTATITASGVSQTSDAQPQGPSGSSTLTTATSSSSVPTTTQLAFCKTNNSLELTLNNGILKDGKGRTGYIASNYQFQFDDPPQAGAIYTSGFSLCSNGSLALGGSTIFWQCLSGNFYNLYDRNWAAQCNAIYIQMGTFVNC